MFASIQINDSSYSHQIYASIKCFFLFFQRRYLNYGFKWGSFLLKNALRKLKSYCAREILLTQGRNTMRKPVIGVSHNCHKLQRTFVGEARQAKEKASPIILPTTGKCNREAESLNKVCSHFLQNEHKAASQNITTVDTNKTWNFQEEGKFISKLKDPVSSRSLLFQIERLFSQKFVQPSSMSSNSYVSIFKQNA